ncbi:MAG: SCO family protein [Pseudomonadota bacterium]|uniref:SCO family protein n=1 Tax=unclassified Phenylobacterium TaxID=2640670 RepID=UPI0006FF9D6B|nr:MULTISPECIES: SCO family protein [unclassified Phenylobacterium]KRB51143.1 photosynthetic protein synthase I [Phenylobacterium sp. Root700]MBT9471528.1 SCO family protein [Phenylobacterium sp.]
MPRHVPILIAACVVGLIFLGAVAWKTGVFDRPPQAAVGGPFQLIDQNGKPTDESILKGKWTVVFFGFTYCPDVCPTTMQALGAAQQQLGPKADQMQVVFMSLDPARDTPAQLKTYLGSDIFPKGTIGLTGTPEQVDAAAKAYRVYYKKNGEGADYLVDHSTAAYLMDPKGRFDRVIPYGISPEEIARQISDAMR